MNAEEAALRAYYERDEERDRLSDGRGQLEFIRTTEILMRRLPPPPAVVADIGGGPGRYADPADRAAILDGARALESVPELAGFGPHLLATAIR